MKKRTQLWIFCTRWKLRKRRCFYHLHQKLSKQTIILCSNTHTTAFFTTILFNVLEKEKSLYTPLNRVCQNVPRCLTASVWTVKYVSQHVFFLTIVTHNPQRSRRCGASRAMTDDRCHINGWRHIQVRNTWWNFFFFVCVQSALYRLCADCTRCAAARESELEEECRGEVVCANCRILAHFKENAAGNGKKVWDLEAGIYYL